MKKISLLEDISIDANYLSRFAETWDLKTFKMHLDYIDFRLDKLVANLSRPDTRQFELERHL